MSGTTRTKRPVRSIERHQGDTWPIRIEVTDEYGVPVNVTGTTSEFVVDERKSPPAGDVSTQKFSLPGVIVDGLGGIIEYTPTAPAAAIAQRAYYYKAKLIAAGGAKITVASEVYTVL